MKTKLNVQVGEREAAKLYANLSTGIIRKLDITYLIKVEVTR